MAGKVDPRTNYSAGIISSLFWLNETLTTIPYYLKKIPVTELKTIAVEQNIYQLRAESRIKRLPSVIYKRLDCLSEKLVIELETTDIVSKRIINLIAIMKSDLLFSEFMYHVFKTSVQLGKKNIENSDIKLFFDNKINQSKIVANFSESSIGKLKQTYVKMLIEANILDNPTKKTINTPYIDYKLHEVLKQDGFGSYLSILTGIDYE